jgi:hypothetical protein
MPRKSSNLTKECRNCEKEFKVKPSRYEREKCCSKECSRSYLRKHGHSEETKKKISATKGGVKKEKRICIGCGTEFEVEKWREKVYCTRECSMRIIGQRPTNSWNTGLTKEDNDKLKELGEQHSQWMKDQYESGELEIWNKGLTTETDERMKKLNDHLTKMRNTDGPWKEMWREAMRKGQVNAWANGSYDRAITQPEQIIWDHLESLGYTVKHYQYRNGEDDLDNTWYFQFPFMNAFVPDFAMPKKKWIIEVNGCGVHGHDLDKCVDRCAKYGITKFGEENGKRDRQKYSMYYRNGWKYAVVWQCEADNGDFHRIEEYLQ